MSWSHTLEVLRHFRQAVVVAYFFSLSFYIEKLPAFRGGAASMLKTFEISLQVGLKHDTCVIGLCGSQRLLLKIETLISMLCAWLCGNLACLQIRSPVKLLWPTIPLAF